MINTEKREENIRQKRKIHKRVNVKIDPENYRYIPEKKRVDYYDDETPHQVAVYVRVSTDDIRQTTSFELQKKYYEEFVRRHPNWTPTKV